MGAGTDAVADATPPPHAAGANQPVDINDVLRGSGVRHDAGHAVIITPGWSPPGIQQLTGDDPLTGKPANGKPAPTDTTKLPPLEIGPTGAPSGSPAATKPIPRVDNSDESTTTKVVREGMVIGGGLGWSFLKGVASLPERSGDIAASMAIGATLSTVAKSGEFGAAGTLLVGAYFTSRFVVNAVQDTDRWKRLSKAVSDTWDSDAHSMANLREVSATGGNFAFDTSLAYAAGSIGYKNKALGDLVLQVIKLPVPLPGPAIPPKFPLTPAVLGLSPYLAVVPAPFLYKHHHSQEDDDHGDR